MGKYFSIYWQQTRATLLHMTWGFVMLRCRHLQTVAWQAWVAFDKGVWPSREVPCSQVRQRQKADPCLNEGAEAGCKLPFTSQPLTCFVSEIILVLYAKPTGEFVWKWFEPAIYRISSNHACCVFDLVSGVLLPTKVSQFWNRGPLPNI